MLVKYNEFVMNFSRSFEYNSMQKTFHTVLRSRRKITVRAHPHP